MTPLQHFYFQSQLLVLSYKMLLWVDSYFVSRFVCQMRVNFQLEANTVLIWTDQGLILLKSLFDISVILWN